MNIEPGESFPICRQLDDPAETMTLYVQATIRNAKTDAVIDTVNLTDQGDYRYRSNWQAIQDASGIGIWITITTKVYEDSGYTAESLFYFTEENKYLIHERYNRIVAHGGGGGGFSIDYKKLKKIIESVVESKLKLLPQPIKQEKVKLKPFIKSLKRIFGQLETVGHNMNVGNKELMQALTTGMVLGQGNREKNLEAVIQTIKDKYIPEQVDLLPTQEAIQEAINIEAQKIMTQIVALPKPEMFDYERVLNSIQEKSDKHSELVKNIFDVAGSNILKAIKADRNVNVSLMQPKNEELEELEKNSEGQRKKDKEKEEKTIKFNRRIANLSRV